MPIEQLQLPADPAAALALLRNASAKVPTFVFKKSPRCPVSFAAEDEWRDFLKSHAVSAMAVAEIDVVNERPLARGLTELLGIRHESPQALLFRAGAVVWHDSHATLTAEAFAQKLGS